MSNLLKDIEALKDNIKKETNLKFETTKIAAEVLLSSIYIDEQGVDVYPTNCPGEGRVDNLLLDNNESPACMYRGNKCPYFESTKFTLDQFDKNIICNAI